MVRFVLGFLSGVIACVLAVIIRETIATAQLAREMNAWGESFRRATHGYYSEQPHAGGGDGDARV